MDGYVNRINIVPGDILDLRSNSIITEVYQLDPIWVCMDYPQERIGDLALGLPAEVVIDSFPRETFKGSVVASLPAVVPETRTLPVYIEVPNPDFRIRSGVSGFARITVAEKQTLVVPSTAMIMDESRAMLFCIVDGRACLRTVTPGHVTQNGSWEIVDGISLEDEVVIFGSKDLRDGDLVDTDWKSWSRRE